MQNVAEAEAALAAAPLFHRLGRADLAELAAASGSLDLGDGAVLPGFPGLYVVASGGLEVVSRADGASLAHLAPGDTFGELEFLAGVAATAGARALGPTRLVAFPDPSSGGKHRSLGAALHDRPELAARVLRTCAVELSERLRRANALVKEGSPRVRELKRQVYGDKLTGLLNRAYLEESLPALFPGPFCLLMLKPDNFKEINDRFGHEVGDRVLVAMARSLAEGVGSSGSAFRYAGNEVGAVYPGFRRDEAVAAARDLKTRLEALDLSGAGAGTLRLSVSLGLGLAPDHGGKAADLIAAVADLPLKGRAMGGGVLLFPEARA